MAEVKMKPTSVIKARLGINPNGRVQKYFTNMAKRYMDKYVPLGDTGLLRSNVSVDGNIITYKSPYAHYQYKGILYVDPETGSSWAGKDVTKVPTGEPLNYHTPGTGLHWDKKMMTAEGDKLIKEVQKYIDRGAR